jgi:site-specific recombinase XerD
VSDLTVTWIAWLRDDQRKSPHTIATYQRTFRTLHADPATATREDIEAWWDGRKHLSVRTRCNELSALRSFYKWAHIWDHRPDDPTSRLTPPKIPQQLPVYLGREELLRLLAVMPDDLRRATALGAYAGLRVSEAASLHWHDVDREIHRIVVRGGKGAKDRMVGLSPLLLDHLLPERRGYVVTGTEDTWDPHTLGRKWQACVKAQGVETTFHKLRARFVTMAVAGGVPLTSVQRAVGHASLATTAIYVGASDTDLDLIAQAVTK